MKSRNIAYALLTSILAVGWGAQIGNAQDAPKDNKGYTASKTTVVDLGPRVRGNGRSAATAARAHD